MAKNHTSRRRDQREISIEEEFRPLLDAARPELYRYNGFRVLGLPVTAEARDVQRQFEKLRMTQKLGLPARRDQTPLPLEPPPGIEIVREAAQRLKDLESRLVDEVFWFWPDSAPSSRTSPLEKLAEGNPDAAIEIWSRRLESTRNGHPSRHNLAVLHHCLALDFELVGASTGANGSQHHWRQALQDWQMVLQEETFWSALTERIRAFDDRRLTPGLARELRASMPLAILSINAQLAVRAAEAGDRNTSRRHVGILCDSGFPSTVVEQALRRALEPITKRLQTFREKTEAEAQADSGGADKPTRLLLEQAEPLLAIIDLVLKDDSPSRTSAHDEVSLSALTCAIKYGNHTTDWPRTLSLMESLRPFAVGLSARKRIEENFSIVKRNASEAICWFCETNDQDEAHAFKLEMYGDVVRRPHPLQFGVIQITWRNASVSVPRCSECAQAHQRQAARMAWRGMTVGALLGALLSLFACGASLGGPGFWVATVVLALLGAGTGAGISEETPSEGVKAPSAKLTYPPVQELQEKGWKFGKTPVGSN